VLGLDWMALRFQVFGAAYGITAISAGIIQLVFSAALTLLEEGTLS
jgi:hypothetical protein